MDEPYEVVVESGSLRRAGGAFTAPHRWTPGGVTVHGSFTGALLLHAAVGGCVLNDVHREAEAVGVAIDGVRVTVRGGFDPMTWSSTGVEYVVETAPLDDQEAVEALLDRVEAVAEIPRAIAAGVPVRRR